MWVFFCGRRVFKRPSLSQYIQWMKTTRDAQLIPLAGKPRYLRTVTADAEKQQAVVEAFRVSILWSLGSGTPCNWY